MPKTDLLTSLKLTSSHEEVALQILVDRKDSGWYDAQVSEAVTGSESDVGGCSLVEVIAEALDWAGVAGFSAPTDVSFKELRQLLTEASEDASFELDISLYASF